MHLKYIFPVNFQHDLFCKCSMENDLSIPQKLLSYLCCMFLCKTKDHFQKVGVNLNNCSVVQVVVLSPFNAS